MFPRDPNSSLGSIRSTRHSHKPFIPRSASGKESRPRTRCIHPQRIRRSYRRRRIETAAYKNRYMDSYPKKRFIANPTTGPRQLPSNLSGYNPFPFVLDRQSVPITRLTFSEPVSARFYGGLKDWIFKDRPRRPMPRGLAPFVPQTGYSVFGERGKEMEKIAQSS